MVKTEVPGVNICQAGGDQEEKALMELNERVKSAGRQTLKVLCSHVLRLPELPRMPNCQN
jgi:hypothetical protein